MSLKYIIFKTNTASKEAIYSHLKKCDKLFIPHLSKRVNLEQYSDKLSSKAITFEAWKEEELVGLIAAYLNKEGNFVFISNISVIKKESGKGIASKLLNLCVEDAKKKKLKEIKLEVASKNKIALNFYKKNKFDQITEKDGLVIMHLLI